MPYVREYLEDREITAWFLLDLSPSVDFGTVEAERLKRSVLVDFVTALARVLTRHGNRVGAMFYGSRVERTIPARGGRVQVLRLINDLPEPSAPGVGAVHRPRRRCSTAGSAGSSGRSLVFVISDFISAPGWERALERLTRGTRSSRSGCTTRARSSCPTSGRCSWTTPRPGSSSYVDTHDKAFRRRFRRPPRAARGGAPRPRSGAPGWTRSNSRPMRTWWPRSSGWRLGGSGRSGSDVVHLAAAPAAPPRWSRSGCGRIDRAERRRRGAGGAVRVAGGSAAGAGAARSRRRPSLAGVGASRRPARSPASRSSCSRSPGRRASSASRAWRARSCSRSTCRGAWPPPTSPRPGWRPPRRRRSKFVEAQPPSVRIGVVVFSDSGLRRPRSPTGDRVETVAAIQRLAPERGTSIGQRDPRVARGDPGRRGPEHDRLLPERVAAPPDPAPTPVPAGVFDPAIIVLLTDGENTSAARSARGGPGRRRTAASASTRSASAARPGPRSKSRGSWSTPSSTRRRSSRSPTSPTARTTRPRTRPTCRSDLRRTSAVAWSYAASRSS